MQKFEDLNGAYESTFEFDSDKDGQADGHPYDWGQFLNNFNFIIFIVIVEVGKGKVRHLSIDCGFNKMSCPRILNILSYVVG